MDVGEVFDLLDKHGDHALLLAMVVMLYLMGKEFRSHRKELKEQRKELERHRDDEIANRSELIRYGIAMQEIGTAVKLLLERDRDRFVREEISGTHDVDPRIAAMNTDDDATPVEGAPALSKRRTPAHGYSIVKRPPTKGGGS
jgi:hypothetical protein